MRFTGSRLNYILMPGDWWSAYPVAGDSWISPEISLSNFNDRCLDGRCPATDLLEVSILPIFPVVGECPMTGARWRACRWPGMPGQSDMSSCPLGDWSVAGRSDARWPVASRLVLPWVQVPRELPPIWVLPRVAGPCPCSHVFFVLFSASSQTELDQLLHVEQVDSLEQWEQLIHFYDYSNAILIYPRSWIVMKVAKTHYDEWVKNNFKKSNG